MDIHLSIVIKSRIYLEGIAEYFNHACSHFIVSSKEDSAVKAIGKIESHPPNVLVIDSSIEDFFLVIEHVKQNFPSVKVIALAFKEENSFLRQCVSCGVEGIVTEDDSLQELKNCISTVLKGRLSYPSEITYHFVPCASNKNGVKNYGSQLTSRQTKVLGLIVEGYSNKEIARKLGIQLATVKNHVHQILDRLNAKNRCEAAAVYRRLKNAFALPI